MVSAYFRRTLALIFSLLVLFSAFSLACPNMAQAASNKPGQVKNLKATAGTTYIKLSWKKVSGSADYAVFFYNPSTDKYRVVANVSSTTYTVKNLNAATTYYYAVQAYNTVSGKRYYGTVSKNVKAKTLSATPTQVKNLKTSTIDATSIKLKWTKITDAKYVIYSYNSKTEKYTKIGTSSTNSYTVKKLTAETDYTFAVRAYKTVKSKNYYGKYSSKLKVTTAVAPLTVAKARGLYKEALDVYMDWVYSCNYISYNHTVTHEFYGMPCQFAAVEHDSIKEKNDLINLLGKYFDGSVYENELYLYVELDGKLYGKLYYYAEGGRSDTDTVTKYYTDKIKKINANKFQYILYPVYYDNVKSEGLPESYTYTIIRKNDRWIFSGRFFTCCADIRDT
ncbi:MAG: fibronectin type III domain-containing protein [Clostridia bacterium]|nr:fibronectin type III domain-containing protein [Clostridia bacterium]